MKFFDIVETSENVSGRARPEVKRATVISEQTLGGSGKETDMLMWHPSRYFAVSGIISSNNFNNSWHPGCTQINEARISGLGPRWCHVQPWLRTCDLDVVNGEETPQRVLLGIQLACLPPFLPQTPGILTRFPLFWAVSLSNLTWESLLSSKPEFFLWLS